uniref:Unkown protein n=1 Tax=Riptortus pedestris TaxID=329032 RepID=R4WKJ6_RIPPE|nr:unkown protein [Riptortus pedestris]
MAFKKFPLPCEDFNTLFTKEELNRPVVVVSIIGRTSIDQVSSHAEKVPNFTENVEELIGNIGHGQDKSFYKSVWF